MSLIARELELTERLLARTRRCAPSHARETGALMTTTGVGYGDITAHNSLERWWTNLVMVTGAFSYAVLFGNVNALVQNMQSTSNKYREKIEVTDEFIETYHIPPGLSTRMRETMDYIWDVNKCFDVQEVLQGLPEALKVDILLYIHKPLISKVPFFRDADDSFVKQLIVELELRVALDGDYIFKEGDRGEVRAEQN